MIESDNLIDLLPWNDLIDSLNSIFQQQYNCPIRHHHAINVPASDEATLLLMPS
jgi:ornithine cyclodeaminase